MKMTGMRLAASVLVVPLVTISWATAAEEPAGREHVLNMAGCHDVTYYFHEDGERDYLSEGKPPAIENRELIAVTEEDAGRIVLQHATIGEEGEAVPHWHEVWTHGEGGWTQSVYGRALGAEERQLRYRCTAPWSMNRWECDIGPAPKPFRDSGAPFGFFREDYARLHRHNTVLVTPRGWVQAESNRKLTEDGELVSYELGYIIYLKWDEETCERTVTDRSALEAPD